MIAIRSCHSFMELKFNKWMMVFVASWALVGGAFAGTFRHIAIDGSFADWTDVPLAYTQAQDVINAVAYQNIYVANDEDYLYVRFSIVNLIGAGTAPQTAVPIPETGVLRSLEALADRYAARRARPDCAIVDVADRLCGELGVSVDERRRCFAAARLRDVGKIGVPPGILGKPAPLTAAERRIHEDHVRVGAELLAALPETRELAPIVAEHHERFDGLGFPAGIAGSAITIEARIIAVAEAWCAAGGSTAPV